MTRGKLLIVALVLLTIGFVAGFVTRPIMVPTGTASTAGPQFGENLLDDGTRSVAYFMAHLDVARRITDQCREGAMRGGECANAETAITTVESKERFKRFRER